jgi:AcrR family transcriptional regulator
MNPSSSKKQLPKLSFLRRAPAQSRGERRVLQIMAATESLLRNTPFDEITIEQIAKHARVEVGSIYFFFTDRTSIYYSLIELEYRESFAVYELTDRELSMSLHEYLRILRRRFTKVWEDRAKTLHDLYYAYRSHAPMRALLDEYNAKAQQQMLLKVASELPHLPPARREILARLINHALQTGLDEAPVLAKSRVTAFRKEWFAMLLHYIENLQAVNTP